MKWFNQFLYSIAELMATILDIIMYAIRAFVGLEPVVINDENGSGQSVNFLESMLKSDVVKYLFLALLIIGLIVIFVITAGKIFINSNSHSLTPNPLYTAKQGLKGLVQFMIVPVMILLAVLLLSTIMQVIDKYVFVGVSGQSLGGRLLFEAFPDEVKNKILQDITTDSSLKEAYESFCNGAYSFENMSSLIGRADKIEATYKDFNYFLSMVMLGLVIAPLISSLIMIIKRVYNVVMKMVSAPIIVANYPLDDGAGFRSWREELFSDLIVGYIVAICLNIYMVFVPVIMSYSIDFNNQNARAMMSLIKAFVLSGAAAASLAMANTIVKALGLGSISTRGTVKGDVNTKDKKSAEGSKNGKNNDNKQAKGGRRTTVATGKNSRRKVNRKPNNSNEKKQNVFKRTFARVKTNRQSANKPKKTSSKGNQIQRKRTINNVASSNGNSKRVVSKAKSSSNLKLKKPVKDKK